MEDIAFDILWAKHAFSDCWHVAGRAIRNVRIGDVLKLPSVTDDPRDDCYFVVTAMVTYNRSITTLHAGLSGLITLKGEQGHKLNAIQKLWHHASVTVSAYDPSYD